MQDQAIIDLVDRLDLIAAIVETRLRAQQADFGEHAERLRDAVVALQVRLAERSGMPSQLLGERLGLSSTELDVVWLLAAISMRPEVRSMVARIGGVTIDPTLDTIRRVVYGERPSPASFAELGPRGRLRALDVIERCDGTDAHESRASWVLSRRILAFLHGEAEVDESVEAIEHAGQVEPLDRLAIEPRSLEALREVVRAEGSATVLVSGRPGLGRRTVLVAAAREAKLEPLVICARRLAKDPTALRRQVHHIAREALLLDRVPLVANLDVLDADAIDIVGRELARRDGLVLATCGSRRPVLRWDRPTIAVELASPTFEQRGQLWLAALGAGSSNDAEILADRYPLAPAMIRRAAATTRARATGREVTPDDIVSGIRAVLDDRLSDFARRLTITQRWEDLVLPQEQLDAIAELVARVRERRRVFEEWGFGAKLGRGLGIAALFSGPPGTGKTMVAGLIARELGLEIYQVDVAKIVSRWLGETEKQLGELFDVAEAGRAILLFDEADALFGKRTDVRSSNDRYANLETNYLLERLESFTGVCFLTTNHETTIDPAFQRRLSQHVRFDVPDAAERARLWSAVVPAEAPLARDVDMAELARRFAMSGGYIRNAVLRAAFLAADARTSITAEQLDRAARVEYAAMGKIA